MKHLDKEKVTKSFLIFLAASISLFASALIVFALVYKYSTMDTYRIILLFLIAATVIIMFVFMGAAWTVFRIYRKNRVGSALLWPIKAGLTFFMPFAGFIAGFFKDGRNKLRNIYVDVNNILILSQKSKFEPSRVLVLLPHCLQNSRCGHKITGSAGNGIDNCRRCGKCSIGDIADIVLRKGVKAYVATGGTAARNIIEKTGPKAVLAVACERELAEGMAEAGGVPVIGLVNERPNGPCGDTAVNLGLFEEKLDEILLKEE